MTGSATSVCCGQDVLSGCYVSGTNKIADTEKNEAAIL